MDTIYFILLLIYGILSAILFFKVWRMCNDVHKVMQHLIPPTTNDNNSNSIDGSTLAIVFIIMVSAIGVIFILSIS